MQETRSSSLPLLPILGLLMGVVLIVIAEFVLDAPADENATWHWIQHGVFFLGGLVVGVSATQVHQSGQR